MGSVSDLIIVGDEAWTPEEWESEQERLERERKRGARRRLTPKYLAYQRKWREQNREAIRAYQREWMRRKRAA